MDFLISYLYIVVLFADVFQTKYHLMKFKFDIFKNGPPLKNETGSIFIYNFSFKL